MPTYKATLIFGFTPVQTDAAATADGRSGGWTENIWYPRQLTQAQFQSIANLRAGMISKDCSIVGFRSTPYNIVGNTLVPGKSLAGVVFAQGVYGAPSSLTNSPEDALRLLVTAGAIPTTFTMFLKGIPDGLIQSNSFSADRQWTNAFNRWVSFLTGQGGPNFGLPALWLGRDPTQISQRVLSVNVVANSIRVAASLLVNAGDWIRLRRVYSDQGLPIKGTFLCTLVTANADGSVSYQLAGLPASQRSTPSGTARKDLIGTGSITAAEPKELASRKIGRPTMLFRGRRTKQRA